MAFVRSLSDNRRLGYSAFYCIWKVRVWFSYEQKIIFVSQEMQITKKLSLNWTSDTHFMINCFKFDVCMPSSFKGVKTHT